MSVYRIEHDTRYVYESAVATSQHVAWLEPRQLVRQYTRFCEVTISPAPVRVIRRIDYFGNIVHQFELLRPPLEMQVVSRGVVDVLERQPVTEAGGDIRELDGLFPKEDQDTLGANGSPLPD
jgi:transglutaminase-like putative cysteine protease